MNDGIELSLLPLVNSRTAVKLNPAVKIFLRYLPVLEHNFHPNCFSKYKQSDV